MKKLDTIPNEVLDHIRSEHERALAKVLTGDRAIAKLPSRIAQMRILRPNEKNTSIESVVVPPVHAYIAKDRMIDNTSLTTAAIRYVLPYTGKPFPYGHIFSSSGYVCLGNIFVPSTVSIYNPQQPLETLFLHNDRNTGHGGASITVTEKIIGRVKESLDFHNIKFTEDAKRTFVSQQNLLKNDALWILSADVVRQAPDILVATDIMDHIFRIVFQTPDKKKGEQL